MRNSISILICSVAIGIVFAGAALTLVGSEARARMVPLEPTTLMYASNSQLAQVRSKLENSKSTTPHDLELAQSITRRLLKENRLSSPQDFFNASRVFARGSSVQSAIMAHEMAIACLAMGDVRAKSLAAMTEDQILSRLGEKQRFGTQAGPNRKIAPLSAGVTDGMRNLFGLPSIITATKLASEGKLDERLFAEISPIPVPMAVAAN